MDLSKVTWSLCPKDRGKTAHIPGRPRQRGGLWATAGQGLHASHSICWLISSGRGLRKHVVALLT